MTTTMIPDKFYVNAEAFAKLKALAVWCAVPIPEIAYEKKLIGHDQDEMSVKVNELFLDLFMEGCSNMVQVFDNGGDPPYVIGNIEMQGDKLVAVTYYNAVEGEDNVQPHDVEIVVR